MSDFDKARAELRDKTADLTDEEFDAIVDRLVRAVRWYPSVWSEVESQSADYHLDTTHWTIRGA